MLNVMSQTWTALTFVIHGGSNGPRTPYSCNRPTSAPRESGHQSSPCLKNHRDMEIIKLYPNSPLEPPFQCHGEFFPWRMRMMCWPRWPYNNRSCQPPQQWKSLLSTSLGIQDARWKMWQFKTLQTWASAMFPVSSSNKQVVRTKFVWQPFPPSDFTCH